MNSAVKSWSDVNLRKFLKTTLLAAIVATLVRAQPPPQPEDSIQDGEVAALSSGDQAEFGLITALGWVRFALSKDWNVLAMETKGPVKRALFQISGEASQGDVAGFGIILYEIGSKDASDAFAADHQQSATGEKSHLGQWEIFKKERKSGETMYSIWTAFRDIADVHVTVRLAWPHLSKNPANYDSEMDETFQNLLKSFNGEAGSYQRRAGEVIRRPD